MNQQGQNTLLVASTLSSRTEEFHVDSEIYLRRKGIKDLDLLKLFLSEYILIERNNFSSYDENKKVAINLLYSKLLNFIQLGMVQINELQKHSLRVLVQEINRKSKDLTNACFLDSLKGDFLFVNKFEFYGRVNQLRKLGKLSFTIAVRRREKKNHFEKYIGVGYKDKGAAKVESEDGFHSWQEIAGTEVYRLKEVIASNSRNINENLLKDSNVLMSLEVGQDSFGNPVKVHLKQYTDELDRVIFLEEHYSKVNCHHPRCRSVIVREMKHFVPVYLRGRRGLVRLKTTSSHLGVILH